MQVLQPKKCVLPTRPKRVQRSVPVGRVSRRTLSDRSQLTWGVKRQNLPPILPRCRIDRLTCAISPRRRSHPDTDPQQARLLEVSVLGVVYAHLTGDQPGEERLATVEGRSPDCVASTCCMEILAAHGEGAGPRSMASRPISCFHRRRDSPVSTKNGAPRRPGRDLGRSLPLFSPRIRPLAPSGTQLPPTGSSLAPAHPPATWFS